MLKISNHSYRVKIQASKYKSIQKVRSKRYYKRFNKVLLIFLICLLCVFFLPWTQNIQGKGYLTTLRPEQRPQEIQSPISGRIDKWFVKEGDFVQKNDTLIKISEIKSEYFDDQLSARTLQQLNFKKQTLVTYQNKIEALNNQIQALENEKTFKTKQARNKFNQLQLQIENDSLNFNIEQQNKIIAQRQYDRVLKLFQEGLKSQKEVEMKDLKRQKTWSKWNTTRNKWYASQNKGKNSLIDISRIQTTYDEKINKAKSTLFSTQGNMLETQMSISKLQTTYTNYSERKKRHFILAPQNGYINKTFQAGIGTTFKSGQPLLNIMPQNYQMAVEVYIKPIDMPLISKGVKTRIQFDGWPAIVFSGWDVVSYGTYGGIIVAIEQFISKNGKYRVLIAPDKNDHPWPKNIKIGSGARTIALLNNVPIWYELWRQINGFPLDFYTVKPSLDIKKKK